MNRFPFATVVGLFFSCCPSAVRRFVITVIVDTVKGMARARAWANICIKRDEGFTPSLAHGNSSASISRVDNPSRIFATLFHRLPSVVFGCAIHSMRSVCRAIDFGFVAATRHSATISKQGSLYCFLRAAITAANPFGWLRIGDSRERHQSSETLIRKVDYFSGHADHITVFGV